ncbi:response regulator transcription factor [Bdellovibrio bacteriovorus]|uniref:response regulator n=1 Tax=Bdellovibrio bacteriovorus TaxID=959 RepID=UPI0021CEB8CF|nr:response regulator transcription factor [Bdellovibrio bacteriovorus]UXR65952.1 response regulator transcription factor [Bdellovibrio bacteriovorus]
MSEVKNLCLLVEDQPKTQEFLVKAMNQVFPETQVFACTHLKEAKNWLDQMVNSDRKDLFRIALVDLGLPDGSGIQLVKKLRDQFPEVLSVVVTIYHDDAHLFEALSAGASGYILKDENVEMIAGILKRIQNGEPPLSPAIAHRLISHFRIPETAKGRDVDLTARESETLALLAKGFTVAEAAGKMGLSAQTVAGYVKIIYQKLHISSRAEATREAIRRGLA